MSPKELFEHLNKRCVLHSGFDIADQSRVRSKKEVLKRMKHHIKWFREWAEEMAQALEMDMKEVE